MPKNEKNHLSSTGSILNEYGITAERQRNKRDKTNYELLENYLQYLEKEGVPIPAELVGRLRELEPTDHNHSARVICLAASEAYDLIRKEGDYPLEPEDLSVILAASILHDVGKSGPPDRPPQQRNIIIKYYDSKAFASPPLEMTIGEGIKKMIEEKGEGGFFPVQFNQILGQLEQFGLRETDLLEKIWRQHLPWGNKLFNRYLINNEHLHLKKESRLYHHYQRIAKIASSHHFLEGDNPAKIDFKAADLSDEEKRDNFLIKLLIVLDQYQGARHRGRLSPEQALAYIRQKLEKKGFGQEAEFSYLLDLIKKIEEKTGVFLLGGTEIEGEPKK